MKTYKVVGTAPILDHQPGETFEQKIPADLEAYLLGIGGIAVVQKPVEKPKATKSADRL
jgi:hypothetical protein